MTRWIAAAAAAALLATPAVAAPAAARMPLPTGIYNGRYVCAQGETVMRIFLKELPDGGHGGEFTFFFRGLSPHYPVRLIEQADGRYEMVPEGPVIGSHRVRFKPVGATLTREGQTLSGQINDPACGTITMRWAGEHLDGLDAENFGMLGRIAANDAVQRRWREQHCRDIARPGSTANDPDVEEVCDGTPPPADPFPVAPARRPAR